MRPYYTATTILLLLATLCQAEPLKLGFLDSQQLLNSWKEAVAFQTQFEADKKQHEAENQAEEAEIKRLRAEVEEASKTLPLEEQADLISQLSSREKTLKRKRTDFQAGYEKKYKALLGKFEGQVSKALDEVVKEQGLSVVVGGRKDVYYLRPEAKTSDITQQVLQKLNALP